MEDILRVPISLSLMEVCIHNEEIILANTLLKKIITEDTDAIYNDKLLNKFKTKRSSLAILRHTTVVSV